ncbi:MAG: aldehyde dehydrogenase family protein, partial [Bacteroidota bacterium]|nr:aldehyde dehydrogenase family protein [Bacteroidota bacterium]
MSIVAIDFGMDKALKQLGLQEINNGTSTGSENFGSGEIISSISPVDGTLIGKVKTTSPEDYEKVIQTATTA